MLGASVVSLRCSEYTDVEISLLLRTMECDRRLSLASHGQAGRTAPPSPTDADVVGYSCAASHPPTPQSHSLLSDMSDKLRNLGSSQGPGFSICISFI
jgi:hypothetical protein